MGSGGKTSGKTKSETKLPGFVGGPLQFLINRTVGAPGFDSPFGDPRTVLPSDFIAPDPAQLQALQGMESLIGEGSPFIGPSQQALLDIINPPNIFDSPGFQSQVDTALQRVVPGIRDQFAGGGGSGGIEANLLGQGVTQAIGNLTADQSRFNTEAAMRAIGMTPGVRAQQFTELDQLFGLGDTRRGFEREQLLSDVGRQEEERSRFMEMLGAVIPLLNIGSRAGTTTSTSRPGFSPIGTALGLGLTGAGVAGGLGWQPFTGGGTSTPLLSPTTGGIGALPQFRPANVFS